MSIIMEVHTHDPVTQHVGAKNFLLTVKDSVFSSMRLCLSVRTSLLYNTVQGARDVVGYLLL